MPTTSKYIYLYLSYRINSYLIKLWKSTKTLIKPGHYSSSCKQSPPCEIICWMLIVYGLNSLEPSFANITASLTDSLEPLFL